jgi:hypothetical protein
LHSAGIQDPPAHAWCYHTCTRAAFRNRSNLCDKRLYKGSLVGWVKTSWWALDVITRDPQKALLSKGRSVINCTFAWLKGVASTLE